MGQPFAVPFPPFEPDKNRFNTGALPSAVNALPIPDGWGPMKGAVTIDPDFIVLTDPESGFILTDTESASPLITGIGFAVITGSISADLGIAEAVSAMISCRTDDGTERFFCGGATKLYELDLTGGYIWNDVSRSGGPAYAPPDRWCLTQFGSFLYACNGEDAEQKIDLENDTFFSANTSAPVARYSAAVGDFFVRGNIDGHKNRVQWSDFNNPQSNDDTDQASFSNYQDLPVGDEVKGIVPLSGGAHIWMLSAVHTMTVTITDTQYPMKFQPLDGARGTNSPYSIALIGQDDYVIYCTDGFYRFSSQGRNPIGFGRVNKWFLSECDQNELENIVATVDPLNQCVLWCYTDTNGTRKTLGYHYVLDRWFNSTLAFQTATQARSFPYEQGGSVVISDALLRAAFSDMVGRAVFLEGDNLAATFETADLKVSSRRSFLNKVRLDGDAASYTVTPQTRDTPSGAYTARATATPSTRTKDCSIRADGLYHKFTVAIPAAEDWTVVQGVEAEGRASGRL